MRTIVVEITLWEDSAEKQDAVIEKIKSDSRVVGVLVVA